MKTGSYTFVVILALGVGLGACAEYLQYSYKNVYRMTGPRYAQDKHYVDENIDVRFWIDEKKIHFQLKNLTDKQLTIDWQGSAFLNFDGLKHKICNGKLIFTSRNDKPDPTILAPGEETIDYLAPVANVKKLEEWTWYIYPLFNLENHHALNNKGKKIGVEFAMIVKGEPKTYSFEFEVSNVMPSREPVE